MENEKLKGCPFCGGTAYVTNDYDLPFLSA